MWEFVRLPNPDDTATDPLLRPYGATAAAPCPPLPRPSAQKSARSRASLLPDDTEASVRDAGPSAKRSARVEGADQDCGAAGGGAAGNPNLNGRKSGTEDGEAASGTVRKGEQDVDEEMEKELMLLAGMDTDAAAAAAEGGRGGEGTGGRAMSPPLPASVLAARELLTSRQGTRSMTTPRGEGPSRLASVTSAGRQLQQQQQQQRARVGLGGAGSRSLRGEPLILQEQEQEEQQDDGEEELEDGVEARAFADMLTG